MSTWPQLLDELNLYTSQGAAVWKFIATGHGQADYPVFIDDTGAGAVEAKPSGTLLHWVSR